MVAWIGGKKKCRSNGTDASFYWQGMVKEMRAGRTISQRDYRPRHAAQRAEFLKMIALSMLMESRFRPSQNASIWQARRGCERRSKQSGHVYD
jgi:hypothetical protein